MRRIPGSDRDAVEMDSGMIGRPSSVWVVTGDGLPMKVTIGSPDIGPEVMIDIANRELRGSQRYDSAAFVVSGIVPLAPNYLSGGDQTMRRGGATFGIGRRREPLVEGGEVQENAAENAATPAAWLVSSEEGVLVLVVDAGLDSASLRDELEADFAGDFAIEAIYAGQMTGTGELSACGWVTTVDPTRAVGPTPAAAPSP